jgi:magnesium-protoporphyrin O-methyltransferase
MHVATAVELSDAYTAVAEQLAREAGFVPDEGMVASTDSSSVDARSASDPLDAATASDPLDAASSGNSGDVATSTRPRRIRRLIGDLAVNPHLAEPTDIVVLAKVVCCYADATRLLAAAGALARRHLVLVYPRPWRVLRPFAQASGWLARRRGSDWRFHVHPEADLMAALAAAGLAVTRTEGRVLWRIVVATRITLWHPLPEPGGNARESALPAHLQWRTHF